MCGLLVDGLQFGCDIGGAIIVSEERLGGLLELPVLEGGPLAHLPSAFPDLLECRFSPANLGNVSWQL